MRRKIATGLVLCALIGIGIVGLSAQAPAGAGAKPQPGAKPPQPVSTSPFDIWTSDKLATPGNLGNFGHYTASIQARKDGAAPETHDGFSHFLMFTSGEGMFTLGGEIVDGPDGKTKTVKGGTTQKIIVGAMYHIPIKTVHWVVPTKGTVVTYWVTNIFVPKP